MTKTQRRLSGAVAVLGFLLVVPLSACGSESLTSSGQASGGGQSASGTTAITLGGALSGPLATTGAACIAAGDTGFQVAMQGRLGSANYAFKFNAPGGASDVSVKTSFDTLVIFIQLPSGSSWSADSRSGKGSGTINVNGTRSGTVNLHLVPSTGSTSTANLDVAGSYSCTTTTT